MNAATNKGKETRNAFINRLCAVLWLLTATVLLTTTVVEASTGFAASNLARAVYASDQSDLRVKVLGGHVTVQRTFVDGAWYPNLAWKKLVFTFDNLDGSVSEIDRSSIKYKKTSSGIYTAQADRRTFIKPTATGFRWQDREGFWIDYDAQGDIVAYGDRNDVKVSFNYEPAGAGKRMRSIADHFGTEVIFFEYTDNRLTAIRDYTNRRVLYHYDADGNMDRVIDVLGNTWSYGYTRSVYTDVKCDIRYEYRNGNLEEVFRNCVPITIVEDKFRLVSSTDPEGRTVTRGFTTNGFLGSVTRADGTKTEHTYDYDSSKRQHYIREKSPGGRITESWLDEDGDVIRKDVNGKTVMTLAKDTAARTRSETDSRGLKTIREYDQWDNVTKVTYPDGATLAYAYDPVFSNVTQKLDERGILTKYEYNAKGNLTRATEAAGRAEQRVIEYAYDAYGNRLVEKRLADANTAESVIAYDYDGYGNVTAVVDPEGYRSEYGQYDAAGNSHRQVDARANVWTGSYDSAGRLTSQTDPENGTITYEYNSANQRTKIKDAANNETLYGFDARGNLTTVTSPYGAAAQFQYTPEGSLSSYTDGTGRRQRLVYDMDGRLISEVDGNGNAITRVYGDQGSGMENEVAKALYPSFTQEFKYDQRGRVVEEVYVLDPVTRQSRKTVYDAVGNRTRITDAEDKTTTYVYDALGRLAKTTDATQHTQEFTYDSRDNLITFKDSEGRTYRFEYNRKNLRIKEVRPLGETTVFTHDPMGNVDTVLDPKGQLKRYAYDSLGKRISERHYGTATATTPIKTVTYTYNDLGHLLNYSNGEIQAAISYDARHLRKIAESINYGTFSLNYGYTYFANGLKKSFTGADGVEVQYTYDSNNQLASIQLPPGSLTVNTYKWFAPSAITLPGGSTRVLDYDPLMRLKSIAVKSPSQSDVMVYQYAYDKADNIIGKTTEHGAYTYAYDDLYRVKAANNPSPLRPEGYTYDAVGNRKTDADLPGEWQYSENNQLTAYGAVAVEYDANGNTTKRTDASGTTVYVYDTSDRLVRVTDGNDNLVAEYSYDPFGRRISKQANGVKTYFLYSDEGLIAEADTNGTIVNAYGYHPASVWGTDPVYLKQGTNYFFYQNDHLGTPQKLIAMDGSPVWRATQQVFGQMIVDAGSVVTNNLRLPGQYFDAETGMHYNWNRYYQPSTGRYLTWDPIGLAGGENHYSYVGARPLVLTDPTGEIFPILIPIVINMAVGALTDAGIQALTTGCVDITQVLVSGALGGVASGAGAGLVRVLLKPKGRFNIGGATFFSKGTSRPGGYANHSIFRSGKDPNWRIEYAQPTRGVPPGFTHLHTPGNPNIHHRIPPGLPGGATGEAVGYIEADEVDPCECK